MIHNIRMKLIFAVSAAIVLNVTACSEMRSTFACGPGAYRDGPVDRNHEPMVASSCPSPSVAAWAEPVQFGTRQYSLGSAGALVAADR